MTAVPDDRSQPSEARAAGSTRAWDRLLRPRSIAVVGASPRSTMARRPLRYLADAGFPGRVTAVNPRYREVEGTPCVPSLADVPEPPDLVLVLVPAARVIDVVEECGRLGVGAVIVLSSGFAEAGPDGLALQRRLADAAQRGGMLLVGPNCQGVVYTPSRLTAAFTGALDAGLAPGSGLAYVGQSGALGGSYLSMAGQRGFGVTAWVSTGNQAGVGVVDAALELVEDPEIHVLSVYLEEIPDGRRWAELIARAREHGTAIVVLRSGRSAAGQRAVVSHTGAMVGPGAAFDAVSRAAGVVLVDDFDELVDTSVALLFPPAVAGDRVAVVTTSGGAGGLAVDVCAAHGLSTPETGPGLVDWLAPQIPAFGSTGNPVDVTAQVIDDASRFAGIVAAVRADPGFDAALVVITSIGGDPATRLAESMVAGLADRRGPLAVCWLFGERETAAARAVLRAAGIPVFADLATPARLFRRFADRQQAEARSAARPPATPSLDDVLPAGPGTVTEAGAATVLDVLGLQRPAGRLARTPQEVATVAAELGGDLVLKVQSPDVAHKSEVGGVRVGVSADRAEAVAAELLAAVSAAVPAARIDGVLVQRRVGAGVELVVGLSGPEGGYPPLLTVGIGGTATELYRDVVSAVAPVDAGGALTLLRRLTGWPLLDGFRGTPPVDVRAAAHAVAVLSSAACALGGRLGELEVNPLIVHADGGGATVADVLLRLT